MENRRIDPANGLVNKIAELERRIRQQETRAAGPIVIRDTLTTTDPSTGVSTIIGQLPDGTVGLQQWVNDVTPPNTPSTPTVESSLGSLTITWNGLDTLGAAQPSDYHHTNVEMSSDGLTAWTKVYEMRGASVSVISTEPAGSTRYFRLISYDYNGNASTPSSIASATVAQLVTDASIQQGLADVQASANTAQATADGKNTIYVQTAQPTGGTYKTGDVWFDSDDSYKCYTYTGSAWQLAQDAATAQATANSKNKITPSATAPTSPSTGDQWIDTANGNIIKVWNGSAWVAYQDTAIASAQTTANSALTAANGKNTNYYQPAQPTGGTYIKGDLWFDTDDGYKCYTYTGSAWQLTQDAAGALATASTKNQTFIQGTAPTAVTVGDLWIDTANGNQLKRWSGSAWVDVRDATIATAQSAATTAQATADGKNTVTYSTSAASGSGTRAGDIWFQRDGSGIIIGQWEWTGSAWASRTIGNSVIAANIDAGKITAGTLDANRIAANSITTSKLFVGDLTNLAADGLFADTSKLNWSGGGAVVTSTTEPNKLTVVTAASGNNDVTNRNIFQVVPGEKIYAEAEIFGLATNVGAGIPNINMVIVKDDGSLAWPQFGSTTRVATTGAWVKISGTVTIPANARTARIELSITYAADAVGNTYYWRNVTARRMAGGELIVDGAITATKIAAGAIAAGTAIIGNAAITDAMINDLNASKINAGTIAAARIGANTITADKLYVGDFENLATINELIPINITSNGQTQVVGGYNCLVNDAGSYLMFTERRGPVPFKPGDKLYYRFTAKATAATTATLGVWVYNIDQSSNRSTATASFNIGTTDTLIEGNVTVPDWTGVFDAYSFIFGLNGVTNKGIKVKNVLVRRMAGGELIVDGAITATKIAAGAIAAGTAIIGNAAITDAMINDLNASKINAGTIAAARIAAGSITADKLFIGSVGNAIPDPEFQSSQINATRIALSTQSPSFAYQLEDATNLPIMVRTQPGAVAGTSPYPIRTNLFRHPSAEGASLPTWTASLGSGTVGTSTAQALSGTTSYLLTCTVAGTLEMRTYEGTTGIPVTVGQAYTFSARGRAGVNGRVVQTKINWYDASGTLLSTSTGGSSVTLSTTAWSDPVAVTATAPASAAYAGVLIRVTTPALNDTFYFDCLIVEQGTGSSWFSGDTPDTSEYDYSWTGTPNASTSTAVKLRRRQFASNPSVENGATTGWSATNATMTVDTAVGHQGTQSIKLVASGTTTASVTVANSADIQGVAAYSAWSGSAWVYTNDSGVSAQLNLYNGNTVATTAVPLTAGTWTKLTMDGYLYTNDNTPSTRQFRIQFTGMAAGKTMWVDEVLFEEAQKVGTYFDGNTASGGSFTYTWAGTANASTSYETPVVGTYAATSSFVLAPADPSVAANGPKMLPVTPGNEYNMRATVYTSESVRIGWRIRLFMQDGSVSTVDTTPFTAASGKRLIDTSYTIPANVVAWFPELLNLDNSTTVTWKIYGGIEVRLKSAGHLIVDGSITAAKIAANTITASNIQAGAITASKLESQLVLASEIVAGPLNDTHASMKSDGFHVYAKDPQTGTVNEVARLGVANTNDYLAVLKSDGTYAATISDNGTVTGNIGNFKSIMVGGKDLTTTLFGATGKGLVAWGQFNGNQLPSTIANGQEKGLFELAFVPDSSRMYAVFCSPVLFTPTNGTATAAAFRARFTSDGTQPTTSSTILAEDFKPILVNGSWTNSYQINGRLIGGFNGSYIRILFTMAASNGAGLNTELGQSPTFWVQDIGPAYPQSGVLSSQVSGGGTPVAVKATYTKYYGKVDQRSFDGNGNFYNYDVGRAYQGLQPGTANGDMRAMYFFGDMTADLAGATINDMQVYVYFDHWYYNSGGTARIGVHGWTGAPPTAFGYAGGGWILDSAGWPKPGGRWLTIPSSYWNGFVTGAYRGITLGVNSGSYTYYGIASDCQIYVQYTK